MLRGGSWFRCACLASRYPNRIQPFFRGRAALNERRGSKKPHSVSLSPALLRGPFLNCRHVKEIGGALPRGTLDRLILCVAETLVLQVDRGLSSCGTFRLNAIV